MALAPSSLAGEEPTNESFFDQHVAPLLVTRCLECHGNTTPKAELNLTTAAGAIKGGESGTVIVPGKPNASYLWERISGDEMPPETPLTPEEKSILHRWIEGGAKWGQDPIDPFLHSGEKRAGYDWWSFQPLRRPDPPIVDDKEAQPLDAFIVDSLQKRGLQPSPRASRRTLVRRLYFALLGLPPTPEEINAFVNNPAPDAYERLADRLLDSPHYGERWARHWLDVARYGESMGFERDRIRPHAWPYRDWVIHAFNTNMPYDEFVRLQLAGDVLYPEDPLAVIASGFLVAAPWDEVGHTQQSQAMRNVVRQDELEDYVGTVAQTFLGLTANCARCHDHKFDPIYQHEYFQLAAALGGVRHGERRSAQGEETDARLAKARVPLTRQIAELEERLEMIDGRGKSRKNATRQRDLASIPPAPKPFALWEFNEDARDSEGDLHGTLHGGARIENGRLILDGKDSFMSTPTTSRTLAAKTLEVWVTLENVNQPGGGVMTIDLNSGKIFDAIVYGEREKRKWSAGSERNQRTKSFRGPREEKADGELVHVAIVYQDDYWVFAYVNGSSYGQPYQSKAVQTFSATYWRVLFGKRSGHPGKDRHFAGSIERAQLHERALSGEEISLAAGQALVTENELISALTLEERAERRNLLVEVSNLRTLHRMLTPRQVYAVVPKQPKPYHRLDRGNPKDPREIVAPGGIAVASATLANFDLKPDAPESERRKKLAEWITHPKNPLTARVIVNRIWHYHFGVGLVDTPNDFGFNGGQPTHPDLLDWLATEFMEQKWSIKWLHKTILTSATYCQSSVANRAARGIDADNRLLWRYPPRRLEAEVLRDSILRVSGALNPTVGGPSVRDFRTYLNNTQFYEPLDQQGYDFQRRSIYRLWARSGRNPLLDVFDCPDPSTTAPKRAVTTTPLQALSLLNDAFVLRVAGLFAARLEQTSTNDSERVQHSYRLAYGREPSETEIKRATAFISEHGLSAFCRVLFNTTEFLYID